MSDLPGRLLTIDKMPAAPSWALGHPPSLRGDVCFFCKLHGCPTGKSTTGGMLNWHVFLANQVPCWLSCFVFPPPTWGGGYLAALNPCSWQRKIPAVHSIATSLASLLWLLFCCSLTHAIPEDSTGSCIALAPARTQLIQLLVYSWGLTRQRSSQSHCWPNREETCSGVVQQFLYSRHFTVKYKHKYYLKGADLELILEV